MQDQGGVIDGGGANFKHRRDSSKGDSNKHSLTHPFGVRPGFVEVRPDPPGVAMLTL
jgi:hypothetical protein